MNRKAMSTLSLVVIMLVVSNMSIVDSFACLPNGGEGYNICNTYSIEFGTSSNRIVIQKSTDRFEYSRYGYDGELFIGDKQYIYTTQVPFGEYYEECIHKVESWDYLNNKQLWSVEVAELYSKHNVQVIGNEMYLLGRKELLCIDIDTGLKRWSTVDVEYVTDSDDFIFCDNQLLVVANNKLFKLDCDNGSLIDVVTIFEDTGTVYEGTVSIASNDEYIVMYTDSGLFCYNINSLKMVWSWDYSNNPEYPLSCADWYSPVISDNFVIVRFEYIHKNSTIGEEADVSLYHVIDLHSGKRLHTFKKDYFSHNNYVAYGKILHCPGFGTYDMETGIRLWSDVSFKETYMKGTICIDGLMISTIDDKIDKRYDKVIIRDITTGRVEQTVSGVEAFFPRLFVANDEVYIRIGTKIFTFAADSLTFKIASNQLTLDNDKSEQMDTSPIIKDGRTLLPARYVTEPLGGQVEWDADERKVTCTLVAPDNPETDDYKENVVELYIGKPTAKVNGVEQQIDPNNPDVVPTIIDGRTMVPMRFLAESLGCEVEWVAETKEIILTYSP